MLLIVCRGLVWTDLKLGNYVFVPKKSNQFNNNSSTGNSNSIIQKQNRIDYFSTDYTCKLIDMESAVKVGDAIIDFSPEIMSPEQAEVISQGQLSIRGGRSNDLTLDTLEPILGTKENDIWALGISILQLYFGRYVFTYIIYFTHMILDSSL